MLQFGGFGLQLGRKLLIFQRTEVDAHIHQRSQYGGTGGHHRHTGIGYGIAVSQAGYIHNDGHQFVGIAGHLHGHKRGKLGSFLNGSAAGGLFFIGGFRHLEAGKHAVVGFGIAVNILDKGILPLQSHTGDVLHQFFMLLIAFLADSKVGNHCRQSRGNGSVQGGDTAATGDGIAARHFIQKLFEC